ncbi:MMPL family transporter [Desulfobulbus sp. F3]|nr:MMPL family transporter [Desulfobulbus sp. F3]
MSQDRTKANIWIQLHSSDSKSMERLVKNAEQYLTSNPPPVELKHEWAGQTYLSMTWQQKLLDNLLEPLPVSGLAVCALLMILFLSPAWGLAAMVPLAFTLAILPGGIGLMGKNCDMPFAVSFLLLALAADSAIHSLRHARMIMARGSDWAEVVRGMFDEPARAVMRNVVIVTMGFSPLLLASVMPYQMAGIFLVGIMLCSGFATLWLLPSLMTVMKR